MLNNTPPLWFDRTHRSWSFYWSNFKISLIVIVLALLFIFGALYLNWSHNLNKLGDYFFSIGYSMALISVFNIYYEAKTREAFRSMLGEINPNIESGVTVHPSHQKVISRDGAIKTYLRSNEIIRIRTSTADNYVKTGEAAHEELQKKINNESCEFRLLLYLPVFQEGYIPVGRHGEQSASIIKIQNALLDSYRAVISLAPDRVIIKFFLTPLHVNFIMLGNERMFSSLTPKNMQSGAISKPCFEIFPTGSDSLFFQFQKEFDSDFYDKNSRISLEFSNVAPLLQNYANDFCTFRDHILELVNIQANVALQEDAQ